MIRIPIPRSIDRDTTIDRVAISIFVRIFLIVRMNDPADDLLILHRFDLQQEALPLSLSLPHADLRTDVPGRSNSMHERATRQQFTARRDSANGIRAINRSDIATFPHLSGWPCEMTFPQLSSRSRRVPPRASGTRLKTVATLGEGVESRVEIPRFPLSTSIFHLTPVPTRETGPTK